MAKNENKAKPLVIPESVVMRTSYIPNGRHNRPAEPNACRYITIHETGNPGATAYNHVGYLNTTSDEVSWHYTVDDIEVWKHLPDTESAFHAGDGRWGMGNQNSIGIEMCQNADGLPTLKTIANTICLIRTLQKLHGIPRANIVQHNRWNGKDCPYNIRRGQPITWDKFLSLCSE